MSADFENIGDYHGHWTYVFLCAPDKIDLYEESMSKQEKFQKAFDQLRGSFYMVERKIEDQRLRIILRTMLDMSYEAYQSGDDVRGARILRECEGFIWKSAAGKLKYVVDAEQRAFGEVVLFASVPVSPYPYEGSLNDLGQGQLQLYEHAMTILREHSNKQTVFKPYTWFLTSNGVIEQIKLRSYKATRALLKQRVEAQEVVAVARLESPFEGGHGLFVCWIEEIGKPDIRVVGSVNSWVIGTHRFHLSYPDFFPLEPAAA